MLADFRTDDVLDDRFVVGELRDRDGLGELYVAYDQTSGDRVALRVLRTATTSPERFAREARVLGVVGQGRHRA